MKYMDSWCGTRSDDVDDSLMREPSVDQLLHLLCDDSSCIGGCGHEDETRDMAKLNHLSSHLIQRASSLWTYLSSETGSGRHEASEGEIIFSKNNICVHSSDGHHVPGYFTIRVHKFLPFSEDGDPHEESTLILHWVPNNFIHKHPKSLSPESSPTKSHVQAIRRSVTENCEIPLSYRSSSSVPAHVVPDQDEDEMAEQLESLKLSVACESSPGCESNGTCSQAVAVESPQLFSVDLRQMKSLRLFFTTSDSLVAGKSAESNSTGQLVIAGRDGQFKVFHFHFGGLDKLVSVLEEWQFLRKREKLRLKRQISAETPALPTPPHQIRQFSVWRPPTLRQDECHIEEGIYSELDEETFRRRIMKPNGQIEQEFILRRIVFFGGINPELRAEVWPFLLRRYPYNSTFEERRDKCRQDRQKYEELDHLRLNMSEEEADSFWKKVQCTVEKDAPRTDRNNPFFAGDQNENVLIMKRILLNYAFHNPIVGYTQGMSDLLAPLLIEMRDESEAFWCFEGLMERTLFVSSPKDIDMDQNLTLLRELLRIMNPMFYSHLKTLADGLELLFTHRWLLLCFKREFPEAAALKIWESAWSQYQTDYFHLFVCLSVIAIYGQEVMDQDMKADEILFHFSTLTLHMDGDLVLKKARGLLYHFRSLAKIPCTLRKLIIPDVGSRTSSSWNTSFLPAVECVVRKTVHSISDQCSCSIFSHSRNDSVL